MPLITQRAHGPLIALSTDFIRVKEYFEAIVASSGDLICTTDVTGRVIYFSPGAEAMLGLTAASVAGRPAHDFYVEGRDEAERLMKLLRASPDGRLHNHETRMKASGGRILHVSLSVSFLKDARGRVIGTLGIAKDISDRVELERRLRELTRTDDLTGLYNQRHFHDRLREEAARARRQGDPLSMIVFDLDGFKQVNDIHGHAAGDIVLREVAERLNRRMRDTDLVARIGGDEFAVICPETPAHDLESISTNLAEAATYDLTNPVGVSIGVAEYRPGDPSMDELIDRADQAMYRVKRAGAIAA